MRRYLIITAVVIVVLGLGAVIYFYFFNRAPKIVVAPTQPTTLPVTGVADTATSSPSGSATAASARLAKISSGPVALGEVVVDTKATTASSSADIAVDFIERQSGNIYSYLVHTKTLTRTSNKTIPGIQSASWLPDGSTAFVRYLSGDDFSTINTYALSAAGGAGFFLPQGLADISVSSTSLLALASGVSGSAASLEHVDGTHAATVFTTPLSALHATFAGKSQYLAYTKPSAELSGDAFLIDATGHFSRVAGPLDGLVALASPTGKWVLVSYTLNSSMQMELVNTLTNATLPLPIATIADKCVWAADESSIYCGVPVNPPADGKYPDDWYQGATAFSDRIWKIDVAGRFAQLVVDFSSETSSPLDAEALAIDPNDTTLVFVNKNDGSLWSYAL